MDDGLLCLKWNNHKTTFINSISNIRSKNLYTDATIICSGEYFQVHKIVLSSCSEFFEEIFEKIDCKICPYIVLKDINSSFFKYILNYMYIGEVQVNQMELPELIKAAESLKIKGLATPDDKPSSYTKPVKRKKQIPQENKPIPKKLRNSSKLESSINNSNNNDSSILNFDDRVNLESNLSKIEPPVVSDPEHFDIKEENELTEKIECIDPTENPLAMSESLNDSTIYKFEDPPIIQDGPPIIQDGLPIIQSPFFVESVLEQNDSSLELSDSIPVPQSFTAEIITPDQQSIFQKRHQCPFCPKSFYDKTKWRIHCRIHTGEKPYNCQFCTYRSSRKDHLKAHVSSRHQVLMVEPPAITEAKRQNIQHLEPLVVNEANRQAIQHLIEPQVHPTTHYTIQP